MTSGYVDSGAARIYFETAGEGPPFVMIHAGVADCRQWNNEFDAVAQSFTAVRYDMRGFGRSEPVPGSFRPIDDLTALVSHLGFSEPLILMGCSMGGGLAMDYALTHPEGVRALVMVGSAPSGLVLDVPRPPKFDEVEKADEKGDLDLVCELETQIWFDGDRPTESVDPVARKLAYDMNRIALVHDEKEQGERLADIEPPAAARLGELRCPVLGVVGACDIPYMREAARHMQANIPGLQLSVIDNAAHLPNMDHPAEFQQILDGFLRGLQEPDL